jgi:hypothetical protein
VNGDDSILFKDFSAIEPFEIANLWIRSCRQTAQKAEFADVRGFLSFLTHVQSVTMLSLGRVRQQYWHQLIGINFFSEN